MDAQNKVIIYISEQFRQGQSSDVIFQQLAQAGWREDQIKQAFMAFQASIAPTSMQPAAPDPASPAFGSQTLPRASGSKRGRIKAGWRILRHCLKLLNGNRYLLRYFVMTWFMVILLNAIFIALIWFVLPIDFIVSDTRWYPLLFLAYLIAYCAINFYAAALANNILDIYKGERRPYTYYIRAARSKFWPIFVYSLISAIIGMILEYVIEKLGRLGQLLSWLIGTAWSVSTMFTLPIIMDTDSSAPSAIKQSFGLFKRTWGEGITAKATAAAPIAVLQILLALIFITLLVPALYSGSAVLFLVVFFVYIFLSLSLTIIGSYSSSLINVALYYYATKHQVPPGFDEDMLNQVFIKSKRQLKKEAKATS